MVLLGGMKYESICLLHGIGVKLSGIKVIEICTALWLTFINGNSLLNLTIYNFKLLVSLSCKLQNVRHNNHCLFC
jgi:hypothetical protein